MSRASKGVLVPAGAETQALGGPQELRPEVKTANGNWRLYSRLKVTRQVCCFSVTYALV